MKYLKISSVALAVAAALVGCGDDNNSSSSSSSSSSVKSVEFSSMPAPTTADKMAVTHSSSVAKVTYSDGTSKDYPLTYNKLFGVKDKVGGNANAAGQLYNYKMEPIMDPYNQPVIAETPDANSLLKVGGNLFLVSHLEYDWLLSDGSDAYKVANWYTRMPMSMLLTGITQATDGKLSVKSQKPLDFSGVDGLWIPCFGSQTPWNTHLGSEEDYDLQYNPLNTSGYATTTAGLKALNEVYYKNEKTANPYNHGIIPEVTVKEDGSTTIVKHYAMGRGTWEMSKVMPDGKTAYMGDDGTHGFMLMFVADKAGDLSAGTIYAAKWTQTSADAGGKANLTWVKLGSGTDADIKALADAATFETIFDAVAPTAGTCPTGYTRVRAGSTADECLTVKAGQDKAAAFLESRRYAALKGATTEFTKMEGIAVNDKDKRLYVAISAIRDSMTDGADEPANDIKLKKVSSGATYSADLKGGQKDTSGAAINSEYVATNMYVEAALLGEDIAADALGNTANPDKVANTDNIFFSEKMRTLFIGEDSGMHVNNFVWAYNVDTKKLSRVLSAVAGAENTGLQVVDDMNGYAYIMSNSQHHGDWSTGKNAEVDKALATIDKFDANIGYIGGLPAIK
ncbi:PhoX family protein [Thiothrix nivea]|uniref:DUF839 domain-containing protein n=1 Tax=Thiothrix nivea (strain ATCC 35100 / DSM 5205 / JP2) TaxID=870187 RepID=A0A656HBY9_THINJ|nr:alkaline phosphatase PhoX [Thiothrix nivea]EIJ33682.1 protein of unknown function DUF839 [Thiothrix nivea DSM 5205]